MHPYVTDSKERTTVPLIVAGASLIVAWFVTAIKLPMSWWLHAPFVLAVYAIISIVFDRQLWRWKYLREIGLVRVPDLNGVWSGQIASSFDNFKRQIPVNMQITQNWRTIYITLTTEKSRSHSVLAGITISNSGTSTLSYEYANEPQGDAVYTLQVHIGRARLSLSKEQGKDVLSGDYYSGGDRHTYGIISLERTHTLLSSPITADTESPSEIPASASSLESQPAST
jgi:hypothetical protein